MSELSVGSLSGLAANSYVVDVAAGSTLDLANAKAASLPTSAIGAGGILQVVSTTKTDTFSESITGGALSSNDISGLTVSITPSSTSSKILVIASPTSYNSSLYGVGFVSLFRDGSQIVAPDAPGSRQPAFATGIGYYNLEIPLTVTQQYLDSPNTTSAVTYSLRWYNTSASTRTFWLNRASTDADAFSSVRTVSTITAIEVAV